MGFVFERQEIEGLILIKPDCYKDNRGKFVEFYKQSEFKKNGIVENFSQDNFSHSKKNVFRGLHFQKSPNSQSKLITCPMGKIIDIAVDLRKNSKTYKKYFKTVLSEENNHFLYIPKNFAHGFYALKDSILLYKTSDEYNPDSESGIFWKDKEINLDLDVDLLPILSSKDEKLPLLNDIEAIL